MEPKLNKAEVQWLRDKIGNMVQVIQQNAEYVKEDYKIDPAYAISDILTASNSIKNTLDELWNKAK